MKSSEPSKFDIHKLEGRAIAQGMRAENKQHEKNMAKAEKRSETMLKNAAEIALSGGVKR